MAQDASEFDSDTAVESQGPGRWTAVITPRWNIGAAPNGGYLLALALRALREHTGRPDPLTSTAHYTSRPEVGPLDLVAGAVVGGRRHATATIVGSQSGVERLRVTATFGDLSAAEGPTHVDLPPPPLPPRDECLLLPKDLEGMPEITQRFDYAADPGDVGWFLSTPSGVGKIGGYLRFTDGREPDTLALAAVADAFPPAVFNVIGGLSWVPTLELTVHIRARPVPGWLRCVFRTRVLVDGYLEEDGEMWDERGALVAMSRQLALVLPPPPES